MLKNNHKKLVKDITVNRVTTGTMVILEEQKNNHSVLIVTFVFVPLYTYLFSYTCVFGFVGFYLCVFRNVWCML